MYRGLGVLTALLVVIGGNFSTVSLAQDDAKWQPPLVADEFTGIALYGYDPVAYFTDAEPQKGIGLYEHEWGGGFWWFVSLSNRDIFARHPEVYAPQLGGHDPVELSSGKLVGGEPLFFILKEKGLYLFASKRNQTLFTKDAEVFLAKAAQTWQEDYVDRFGIYKK